METCKIEIGDDFLAVEVDGVRAEARGEIVDGVKRQVALHLLRALSEAPQLAEMNRQREAAQREFRAQYGEQAAVKSQYAALAGLRTRAADRDWGG